MSSARPPIADPALPTLALALDPVRAEPELRDVLAGPGGGLRLEAVRLVRLKPGRRCLVEYDLTRWPGGEAERLSVLAKIRRNRSGRSSIALAGALWDAGFDAGSRDGVSVPEPLGRAPGLKAWLQRKVPGRPVTELLTAHDPAALMPRLAQALRKVHDAPVGSVRTHTMADELAILDARLRALAIARPELGGRLVRLLDACLRAAGTLDRHAPVTPIHRDFYADQVIVDRDRLWLLDFDLHCIGDAALDAGNFLGHLTEQALREHGDPRALRVHEESFADAFLVQADARLRAAVGVYADLTLARHVQLSSELTGRGHLTEPLLELGEQRLRIAPRRML
jgi:hypothetical protein